MIYDMLTNVEKYRGISKNLDTAIDFLVKTDLSALPLGRTEINGDNVFANVMEAQAKPVEELNFEIHKKYMDIQIDIEGTEVICIGLGEAKSLLHFPAISELSLSKTVLPVLWDRDASLSA